MKNMLKFSTSLCLLLALSVKAIEGDYILEERFQSYLLQAKDGEIHAQFAVGEMYQRGRGVEASDEDALHWFSLSASQGNLKAAYKAAYLYLHSNSVPQSPQKAVPLLKLAADAGYPAAQYELGLIYGKGLGGFWDSTLAIRLLAKAKVAGYKPAYTAFDKAVGGLVGVKSNALIPAHVKSPVSIKPKTATMPRVADPRFHPNVAGDKPDPKQMILARQWENGKGPSAFLPSAITNCRDFSNYIECMSTEQTKHVLNAKVIYRIRTRISDIQENGRFHIDYANNVLSATNETGTKAMRIKTGWQVNEHSMECSMNMEEAIKCSRGNSKQFHFSGH
jgi:hypothetical protein